jgi:hypothetical protein
LTFLRPKARRRHHFSLLRVTQDVRLALHKVFGVGWYCQCWFKTLILICLFAFKPFLFLSTLPYRTGSCLPTKNLPICRVFISRNSEIAALTRSFRIYPSQFIRLHCTKKILYHRIRRSFRQPPPPASSTSEATTRPGLTDMQERRLAENHGDDEIWNASRQGIKIKLLGKALRNQGGCAHTAWGWIGIIEDCTCVGISINVTSVIMRVGRD